MTCKHCQERRDAVRHAILDGKISEAVRQTAIWAAELVGVKKKPAAKRKLRK